MSYEDFKQGANNVWNNIEGLDDKWFGKSTNDIVQAYKNRINNAQQGYDDVWKDSQSLLTSATKRNDGTDRTIASSLDTYDARNEMLKNAFKNNMDSAKNATNELNKFSTNVNPQVAQAVAGSAASRLVGGDNAVNSAMNTANANQWGNASNQALQNGQTNLNALNGIQGMTENQLAADATPQQDLIALNQDWATNNLNTATQVANMEANSRLNDRGMLGNFFGKILGG